MAAVNDERYMDEAPARGPRLRYTPPPVEHEEAYRKATRHSALVRSLKFVLPAIALGAVVAFWATARIIPGDLASLVASAGIDPKTNSVVMDKPHISGFEGTRRAYEVRAETAVQGLGDPKVVTFKGIVGRFGMEDGGTATVNAAIGVYDGNHNTLMLKQGITLTTTSGYSGRFTDAAIDLGKGTMTTSNPMEFAMTAGKVAANALDVRDSGKRVIFSNGVSVTYLPAGDLVEKPTTPGASTP
jgi:lipopolysaccharide export system protein LptC